ncbi:hypothetical protein MIND_00657400 [Mycena indigotica]|uniref:Uncharacterized protein n=1 Tax=Mycena indigotica TaxID=2126181 RepID=A0A8H6SLD8_9AGAR|nr:uncharacterized protein MIND_00657400 [Mycena indigotica]KAF7300945.1 hypothetical protein MIND_00657400 [Mycena indigotica]
MPKRLNNNNGTITRGLPAGRVRDPTARVILPLHPLPLAHHVLPQDQAGAVYNYPQAASPARAAFACRQTTLQITSLSAPSSVYLKRVLQCRLLPPALLEPRFPLPLPPSATAAERAREDCAGRGHSSKREVTAGKRDVDSEEVVKLAKGMLVVSWNGS